jgi:hypothetical protein
VIYSIEPTAITDINYHGGKLVSLDLNCGCRLCFHTMAMHVEKGISEMMVGRDTVWKCTKSCTKPCPVMLEERNDQAAH